MRYNKNNGIGIVVVVIIIIGSFAGLILISNNYTDSNTVNSYPDFYTKTEDYFVTHIGAVPEIRESSYYLEITGFIENSTLFSLSELRALPVITIPLTIECIGNPASGGLISTANWTGFSIYNLLDSLGIKSEATGVKYYAADGYYATHTMEQLINNSIIGALFMNYQTLPLIQGFPLRIINPGFYGAKQPAWVVKIEVIDIPLADYWDDFGWDTSPRMSVDSKIFFPENHKLVKEGEQILIGGAAHGGTRISKVEYTLNDGLEWFQADIIKSVDFDNVWVFWEINLTIVEQGILTLYTKATDIFNQTQPKIDASKLNGDNSWPSLIIEVIENEF